MHLFRSRYQSPSGETGGGTTGFPSVNQYVYPSVDQYVIPSNAVSLTFLSRLVRYWLQIWNMEFILT